MAKRRGDGESVFDKRFVAHGRGTVFLRTLQAEISFLFFFSLSSSSSLSSSFKEGSGLDDFVCLPVLKTCS